MLQESPQLPGSPAPQEDSRTVLQGLLRELLSGPLGASGGPELLRDLSESQGHRPYLTALPSTSGELPASQGTPSTSGAPPAPHRSPSLPRGLPTRLRGVPQRLSPAAPRGSPGLLTVLLTEGQDPPGPALPLIKPPRNLPRKRVNPIFGATVVPHRSNIRRKGQSEGCRAEGVREQQVPEDTSVLEPWRDTDASLVPCT